MSFDFRPSGGDKDELYRELLDVADAMTAGEQDGIANMANVSALLFDWLSEVNWAGFYRLIDGELVLGPFQGRAACIRIPLGKGVCGTAAERRETQVVADVHAFPGHIACDTASASEICVPIIKGGELLGVLDIDSPVKDRFDAIDRSGLETLLEMLTSRL